MINYKNHKGDEVKQCINKEELNSRQSLIKERIFEAVCEVHETFLNDLITKEPVD